MEPQSPWQEKAGEWGGGVSGEWRYRGLLGVVLSGPSGYLWRGLGGYHPQ